MKIVQSFWCDTKELYKLKGGYLNLKFLLTSWALSCLRLRKYYSDVNLVTDALGKDLLVNGLGLPYSSVRLDFEDFETPFPSNIWTIKKLYAYTLFGEPFIHVDGDVFIWHSLPKALLDSDLIAQNADIDLPFYRDSLKEMKLEFDYMPTSMFQGTHKIVCSNAGIIGGTKYEFFEDFYSHVYTFLLRNIEKLDKVNPRNMSTVLEQYLYNQFANEQHVNISYLFGEPVTEDHYPNLHQFFNLPNECKYIHLMEGKSNYSLGEQMCQRLLIDDVKLFEKVLYLVKDISRRFPNVVEIDKSSNGSSLILRSYWRTLLLLSSRGISSNNVTCMESVEHLIDSVVEEDAKAVLEDAFYFESVKREYLLNIYSYDTIWRNFVDNSNLVNWTLQNHRLAFCRIRLNPYCKFIETSWNWCEKNEFNQHIYSNCVRNFHYESFYYKVVLFVYAYPLTIKEYLLDPLSITIIDTIENHDVIMVNEMIDSVAKTLLGSKITIGDSDLMYMVHEKIQFFLYQNVLTIVPDDRF